MSAGTLIATYVIRRRAKIRGFLKVALVNRENLMSISYQEDISDNYGHIEAAKELINNINKLEELEKRLSFMLREIDLAVNKG